MIEFDAIVIGAGHNGLITAGYLAKAGMSVIVLERRYETGGGLCTEEIYPGSRYNLHSIHHHDLTNRPFFKDLNLEKFGVKYIEPAVQLVAPSENGKKALLLYNRLENTLKNMRKISERDANTYESLNIKAEKIFGEFINSMFFNPPLSFEEYKEILCRKKEGEELLPFFEDPPGKVFDETFEDDLIKSAFVYGVMSMAAVNMDTPNYTGDTIRLLKTPHRQLCVGGSHQLAHAQVASVLAHGGIVLDNCEVEKIIVENGVAKGVKLSKTSVYGDIEIRARKAVVSSVNPILTFVGMIGEDKVDSGLIKKIKKFKPAPYSLFSLHLTLKEPPKFVVDEYEPDANLALKHTIGYEDLSRQKEQEKAIDRGELPMPYNSAGAPGFHDKTQTDGLCNYYIWIHVPAKIKGDMEKWDDVRVDYSQRTIEFMRTYISNFTTDNIIHEYPYTPLDIYRKNPNMLDGDWHVGAMTLDQVLNNRPLPELSNYRTPIKNLYMCGACMHPGGGILGACGYNAAGVIFEDLGIPKEKYMTTYPHPRDLWR